MPYKIPLRVVKHGLAERGPDGWRGSVTLADVAEATGAARYGITSRNASSSARSAGTTLVAAAWTSSGWARAFFIHRRRT